MANQPFEIRINARTHLVVESTTGRCLGGVGSNAQRSWVFPFYTPAGHTVIQESTIRSTTAIMSGRAQ